MKKLALLFVGVFAVSAFAQEIPVEKFQLSKKVQVTLTSVSLEKYGPKKDDKSFKAGDTVFLNYEMKGLQANDQGQVVIQADINIPQLSLDKKNLIDGSTPSEEVVPMYFQIPIGEVQQPGLCEVTITVRDMVAKTKVDFKTDFKLSDDIITFYCERLKTSLNNDYKKLITDMPGIDKKLKECNYQKNKETIIKYAKDNNKNVFIIVPSDSYKNYMVIPGNMKSGSTTGCGVSFEKFTGKKLFNLQGVDFYRVKTD
jgi:hypothetical protein